MNLSPLPASDLLKTMNPAAPASTSGTSGAAQTTQAAQDRFMTLLVTQMKNQDPLNPLDNAQLTSQLAQLSTVTGIDKLNSTVQALMASTQSGQSLQAAGLIGRAVLVPGNAATLTDGKALFGVELAEPVDALELTITDAAGRTVRTLNLGPQAAGAKALSWDGSTSTGGPATDGRYQLQFSAQRGGQSVSVTPLAFAEVNSVSMTRQGAQLNLGGTVPSATLAEVRQIL